MAGDRRHDRKREGRLAFMGRVARGVAGEASRGLKQEHAKGRPQRRMLVRQLKRRYSAPQRSRAPPRQSREHVRVVYVDKRTGRIMGQGTEPRQQRRPRTGTPFDWGAEILE
jgi:hypothetical protein